MKNLITILTSILLCISLTACEIVDNVYENLPPVYFDESSMGEDLNIDNIKKLNNGEVEISYLNDTDIVQEINGAYTTMKILTIEDAVASLTNVRSIMKIEDFSFYCEKTENENDTVSFELKQLYKGVPVYNGVFKVTASKDGCPLSVSGVYISGIDGKVSYGTEHDAKKLISSGKIISQELMVHKNQYGICRTIWRFTIKDSKTSEYECVFMDAVNKVIFEPQ